MLENWAVSDRLGPVMASLLVNWLANPSVSTGTPGKQPQIPVPTIHIVTGSAVKGLFYV